MSYKEAYDKAKKEESLQQITATYKEWNKKGEAVIGEYIHVNQVPGRQANTHYNQYLFQTDDGLIKFSMGGVTDNEAGVMMRMGEVYRVEFQGQEEIRGGQRVNRFLIERLTAPDVERVGGPGDEPF